MRDIIVVIMIVCVSIASGAVWGWKARGRSFDRDRITLEAAVRLRTARENAALREEIEVLQRQLDLAERAAVAADDEKRKAIADMAKGGVPVSPGEINTIDAMIEEAAR